MNRTDYQAFVAYGLAAQRAEQIGLTRKQFELLTSKQRRDTSVKRRAELMRFLRDLGYSFPVIGRVFNRDHSTVMYHLQIRTDCEVGALQ